MGAKVVSNHEQFARFLKATEKTIGLLNELAADLNFDRELAFRILHTLEGEAGAFSMEAVRLASRESQEYLHKITGDEHYTAFCKSLDSLKSSYDSFVEKNNYRLKIIKVKNQVEQKSLNRPLAELMSHMDQLARSVAAKQGKQIYPIEFNCNDIHVSPYYWKGFLTSLVHVIRNAVDHGLETPEEREAKAKTPQGRISIEASYLDSGKTWIRMEIADDGRGIDTDALYNKAVEKIPTLKIAPSERGAILQLAFHPGISLRNEIAEFSGRGVGMDVVHFEVDNLGGKVWVESVQGEGCRLIFELPLGQRPD